MIRDPRRRGEALARLYRSLERALWRDLAESGMLPAPADTPHRARLEWQCLALYACVRGLVAAGGFNTETAAAVDHLHDGVTAAWERERGAPETIEARRSRVAERYAEYGRIGQELEARGAALVAARLGEACARHIVGGSPAPGPLAELLGAQHEALVDGATTAVREGLDPDESEDEGEWR